MYNSIISQQVTIIGINISQYQWTQLPNKKTQANRTDMETGSILLWHTRNIFQHQGIQYISVKGWKNIFQAYGSRKQAGIAIVISSKIDFKPKLIKRDVRHFILIKEKKSTKMAFKSLISMTQMKGHLHLQKKKKKKIFKD